MADKGLYGLSVHIKDYTNSAPQNMRIANNLFLMTLSVYFKVLLRSTL